MHAEEIMVREVVSCRPYQTVEKVLEILKDRSLRMIPVVDAERRVIGALDTIKLLAKLVPEYIVSGDLKSVSYAPDFGFLYKHYLELRDLEVSEVMDTDPTLVKAGESLLSVATSLIVRDFFDYAIVVDDEGVLVGIISPSDILGCLARHEPEETFDA